MKIGMKTIVLTLTMLLVLLSGPVSAFGKGNIGREEGNATDKKVALVLCGGGAKGAAHVGVLKVLEEAGVKIDMIVGTSIGGIVGGMYSVGYSANEMDTIMRSLDWSYLLSNNTLRVNTSFSKKSMDKMYLLQVPFYRIYGRNGKEGAKSGVQRPDRSLKNGYNQLPAGFINGQNIYNYFNDMCGGYQDSIDFSTLPIPFACVATDLERGREVVLTNGYLPLAMRATMAIPGFFSPVTIDGRVLVDGGVINNFPTDVARKLGADVVIGVDIQSDPYTAEQLQSLPNVVNQIVGLMGNEKYEENIKDVDIYIKPNVDGYSTYSFTKEAVDSLIVRGVNAALAKKGALDSLVAMQGGRGGKSFPAESRKAYDITGDSFYLASIEATGVSQSDLRWLLTVGGLSEHSFVSGDALNRAISIFYGTNAFSSVSYKLQKRPDNEGQNLLLEFKRGPANILALGARFDSEETAAILLHLGLKTMDLFGSRLAITGRLSYNAYGKVEYSYVSKRFPKVGLSYDVRRTDMNIYRNGEIESSLEFVRHKMELSLSNIYLRNFDFSVGARFETYNYLHLLRNSNVDGYEGTNVDLDVNRYLSYFTEARMDNRDNKHFPTRGNAIDIAASVFHPGFCKGNSLFGTVAFYLRSALPLSERIALLPSLYYRSYMGRVSYLPYGNFAGGSEIGRYVAHQMPFMGINYADLFDRNVIIGRLDLRGSIVKNHYLYAIVNYMREGHVFENMFNKNGTGHWGLGVKYSYDTPVGPISLNCHWSDYNKKVGLYFSLGYYF